VIYSYPNAVFFSLFALGFVVLYVILAGAARFRPTQHQTTSILGEQFLLWWIILAIDVKGLLVTRAFFFAPFLYFSALIGLAAMLLQSIRPPKRQSHPALPGAIRLPEDNDGTPTQNGHNAPVKTLKERLNIFTFIREQNFNLRRTTIVGITFATQLGFFIVLMVMKNKWIQYQQPLASKSPFRLVTRC
jgi:hypothetical protein